MKKAIYHGKDAKSLRRTENLKAAALKKLGKKRVTEISALASADSTSTRRTSRGKRRPGRSYLRPMSVIDIAIAQKLPVSVVRGALGPRLDVVRRYRQCMAQKKRRRELKMAQESGCWV